MGHPITSAEIPHLLYTVDETMRILRVGRTKLYEMLRDGYLDRISIGSRAFVTAASVESYVQRLVDEGRAKTYTPQPETVEVAAAATSPAATGSDVRSVARAIGAPVRDVARARAIRKGAPDLAEQVMAGTMSLDAAEVEMRTRGSQVALAPAHRD